MNDINIMLLFLSDVKVSNGEISVATYSNIGEPKETETTNESAVRYLINKKNKTLNKIFVFVSKKVSGNITYKVNKDEIVDYKDENGKTYTHLEYFKNRIMNDVITNIDDIMEKCDFDEDADIQGTMETVIKMASMIQNYIKNKDNEVRLHVDMTGGMRHASMMMLVLTRLIQYTGVKIGHILYSNYSRDREEQFVEESNEIYNLFDVISGAYEFVSFGSVEAIQKYFKNLNPQGELKNLLDAMERFSNAIKICQTSVIEDELKNLNTHIETFQNSDNKNLHEKLLERLIETIQKEYGKLLNKEANRIDIIRWCISKGFWQQVLTLCTEWLPELIVDYFIYYTNDDKIKFYSKIRGEKYRNWKQNLVISYRNQPVEEKKFESDVIKTFFELMKILSNDLIKEKITFDEAIKKCKNCGMISQFLKEYEQILGNYSDCGTILKLIQKNYGTSVNNFKNDYPNLGVVLQNIYNILKLNKSYRKKFLEFLDTIPHYGLLKFLFDTKNENNRFLFNFIQLKEIFNLKLDKNLVRYVIDFDNLQEDKKWTNRKNEYLDMLSSEIKCTNLKASDAMEFLKGFYRIRNKRNQINHASGNAANEISDLKDMVETYLNELEKYKV